VAKNQKNCILWKDLSDLVYSDPSKVRERIEAVGDREIRLCLMCTFLFAGRISEVVSYASPGDKKTKPRGPRGTEVRTDMFKLGPIEEEAAIFTVRTAKRKGLVRLVALPFNGRFEPWTKTIYDFYREVGEGHLFPFTRQKAWIKAKEAFQGLQYSTGGYSKNKNYFAPRNRPFTLHSLRHIRASQLVEYYGFDSFDLSSYCGWSLERGSMSKYIHLSWMRYFPKLLKAYV